MSRKSSKGRAPTLLEVKKTLSPKLLPLDFVSGVGVSGSALAVYTTHALHGLEADAVQRVVDEFAPGTKINFVTTGAFQARPAQ